MNTNDYGNNNSVLLTGASENSSNRNLSTIRTTKNRSKSIDPSAKKLAKLPETTRMGRPTNLNATEDTRVDITITHDEISIE